MKPAHNDAYVKKRKYFISGILMGEVPANLLINIRGWGLLRVSVVYFCMQTNNKLFIQETVVMIYFD